MVSLVQTWADPVARSLDRADRDPVWGHLAKRHTGQDLYALGHASAVQLQVAWRQLMQRT
jgi:hypothetical protein